MAAGTVLRVASLALCLGALRGAALSLEKVEWRQDRLTCGQGLADCSVEDESIPLSDLQPNRALVLTRLRVEAVLCCQGERNCSPCLKVLLTLTVRGPPGDEDQSGDSDMEREDGSSPDSAPSLTAFFRVRVSVPGSIMPSKRLGVTLDPAGWDRSAQPSEVSVSLVSFLVPMGSEVLVTAEYPSLSRSLAVPVCSRGAQWKDVSGCEVPMVLTEIRTEEGVALLQLVNNSESPSNNLGLCVKQGRSRRCMVLSSSVNPVMQIPLYSVTPCMCFEVWWIRKEGKESVRLPLCPFQNHTEFLQNVWNNVTVSVREVKTRTNGTAISWNLTAPCRLEADLWLCERAAGRGSGCREIQGSRQRLQNIQEARSLKRRDEFIDVDPHPWLCVQAAVQGMDRALGPWCPFAGSQPQWGANPSIRGHILSVSLTKHVSLCRRQGNDCLPLNITRTEQGAEVQVRLGDLGSSGCVEAWRTDVRFSPRVVICPADIAYRGRWSLPVLVGLLLISLTVLAACVLQGTLKSWVLKVCKLEDIKGAVCRGQVVLLYPPDDEPALPALVCRLGSALAALGFSVSLDLWSQAELSALGPVPWLHARLGQLQRHGGKVVLILTRGAWERAEAWARGRLVPSGSPYSDVFSASLSCILADCLQGRAGERFLLARFESAPLLPLHAREGSHGTGSLLLPEIFRGLPLYSLPSQSLGFLTEISGPPPHLPAGSRGPSRGRRAAGLRAASRVLAGRLRGGWAGAGMGCSLSGCSQGSAGSGLGLHEEMWETVPLQPHGTPHCTPPSRLAHWV
ncbi:interleukin-17 receptor C isoform X2 [Lepisosteus oculatus]|uniref:interleukin-17 receptor C isoform X2 n=1 Tax=Lepisosteus oculatus TaxID=7918 RepID=UPI00372491B4